MQQKEPFLTFVGTTDMDETLHKRLMKSFVPRRLQYSTPTRAIISKQSLSQEYSRYNQEKHENIVIDDPIFDIANEVIVHGKDKVSLIMYTPTEMSGLIITSKTLHNCLKSMFNLIRKVYSPVTIKNVKKRTK